MTKDLEETEREVKMCCVLIVVVVTQMLKAIRSHQIVCFKQKQSTECKLYFNEGVKK